MRLAHLKTKSINSRVEGLVLTTAYALANQPRQGQRVVSVNYHIAVHEEAEWKLQVIEMVCSLGQPHPFFFFFQFKIPVSPDIRSKNTHLLILVVVD